MVRACLRSRRRYWSGKDENQAISPSRGWMLPELAVWARGGRKGGAARLRARGVYHLDDPVPPPKRFPLPGRNSPMLREESKTYVYLPRAARRQLRPCHTMA